MVLGNWIVSSFVPAVDETRLAGEAPGDYVLRLAESGQAPGPRPAAGTPWRQTRRWLMARTSRKPADADGVHARRLEAAHQVYTGLAVLSDSGRVLTDVRDRRADARLQRC
jgi:predicted house-cleaning NTP pyrophosphatase (Maf/HAM1 superfamily)